MDEKPRRFPPSLSAIKSDFERHIAKFGDAFNDNGRLSRSALADACRDHPYEGFSQIVARWQSDPATGPQHWPAMAFAVDQYQFSREQHRLDGPEPTSRDVRAQMRSIEGAAAKLALSILELRKLADRVDDLANPSTRGHLTWLYQLIAYASAGTPTLEIPPDYSLATDLQSEVFVERVVFVEMAAKLAAERVDPTLLSRKAYAFDRGLLRLVKMSAPIWTSLSGRPASANKVNSTDTVPAFVRFVRDLVVLGDGPEPSERQVQLALDQIRPTH